MSSMSLFIISLLMVIIAFLINKEWVNRRHIKDISHYLDEIIDGNDNLKIHIKPDNILATLVFKINELVDFYQSDKIKANRKEQARKQMLSNLSHDVRTPLTSVLGYLDALCSGMAGDKSEEYLMTAKNKAYELKDYIEELFTVARIDADEIQLSIETVDLYELLRRELIGWVPYLQQKNITLEVEIPNEECFIKADMHVLTRIFSNLIQNAVRYGAESRFIGVSAWSEDAFVHFQIWDKGPGLSKDEIHKVFERLYKGDTSRSTKGHGLGLSIAKELTEKLHGSISMESLPYVKTAVKVSLPIK